MIDSRAHTDHSSTHRVKDTTTLEYEIEDLRRRLDTLEGIVASALEMVLAQDVIDYGAPRNTPAECKAHTCNYFTQYLARGPKDLEHEGFHALERTGGNHIRYCTKDRCLRCSDYEKSLRV